MHVTLSNMSLPEELSFLNTFNTSRITAPTMRQDCKALDRGLISRPISDVPVESTDPHQERFPKLSVLDRVLEIAPKIATKETSLESQRTQHFFSVSGIVAQDTMDFHRVSTSPDCNAGN